MWDLKTTMLALLSLMLISTAATLDDDIAKVNLRVDDATDQYSYWKANVGDVEISLEFQPEVEGGSSTGAWSASLEYNPDMSQTTETRQLLDIPDDSLPPAQHTVSTPVDEETSSHEVRYTESLGRYTLVRKPALDYDSARQRCEARGGRLAMFKNAEDLHQLRQLKDLHISNLNDDGDTFVDVDDGYGQPLNWQADEFVGKACLAMVKDGELFLRPCEQKLSFFCEESEDTTSPPR